MKTPTPTNLLAIAFCQQNSELNIELPLDNWRYGLEAKGMDMARRFGDLAALGTVANRLWELQRVLVVSPAYLARCDSPHKLAELNPAYATAFLLDGNALTLIGPQGNETVNSARYSVPITFQSRSVAKESGLGVGGA